MTPLEVLEFRDRLAESMIKGKPAAGPEDDRRRLSGRGLAALILHAQLLTWRRDIWAAAQAGWKAFVGSPADELAAVPPQIWFLEEGWDAAGHPWLEVRTAYPEILRLSGALLYLSQPHRGRAPQLNLLPFSFTPGLEPGHRVVSMVGAGSVSLDGSFEALTAPLGAGLKFLEQGFVGTEPARFPRHVRRAAQLKRRPPLTEVNTVVLRRAERDDRPDEPSEPREWSCSWIRSGHWQRHWWPKQKVHRPTYIAPQLRGDPDLPLHRPKGLLYDVRR